MTTYPRVALGTIRSGSGELWTEHPIVAVDLGNGVAGCVTLDKGWTLNRNWSEVTVEKEYTVYSPEFPQEQKGWQAILRLIAEAQSAAAAWEDQALDYEAHLELAEQRIRELEAEKVIKPELRVLMEEADQLRQHLREIQADNERYFSPVDFSGKEMFEEERPLDRESGPFWFTVQAPVEGNSPTYSAAYVETCNGVDLTAEQALRAGRILLALAHRYENPPDRLKEMRRNVSMQIWGQEFHELDEECQEFVTAAAERLIQKEDEDA